MLFTPFEVGIDRSTRIKMYGHSICAATAHCGGGSYENIPMVATTINDATGNKITSRVTSEPTARPRFKPEPESCAPSIDPEPVQLCRQPPRRQPSRNSPARRKRGNLGTGTSRFSKRVRTIGSL